MECDIWIGEAAAAAVRLKTRRRVGASTVWIALQVRSFCHKKFFGVAGSVDPCVNAFRRLVSVVVCSGAVLTRRFSLFWSIELCR